jgi:lipid-A-disaccharide synthase
LQGGPGSGSDPFFDEVADHPLDVEFCRRWTGTGRRTIGILPGSRTHEVTRNWPLIVELMERIHAQHPDVRFLVACYKDKFQDYTLQSLDPRQRDLPIYWFVGRTPEIIEASDFCIMVSGSVSLEMLARTTPAVVMYSVSRMLYAVMRPFLRVKSITLPNLISGRRLLPEWVVAWTPKRDLDEMMSVVDGWLSNPIRYRGAVDALAQLQREIVRPGATARAAEAILQRLPGPALRGAA